MIKDRVIQVIDFKRLVKETFFEKIGMTSANFRGNAKKTPLNSTAIENILSELPDINIEWLITGKGNMLKEEINSISQKGENGLRELKELIDNIDSPENLDRIKELKNIIKDKERIIKLQESEIARLRDADKSTKITKHTARL